jgi:xylulokinase
MNHHYLLAHDLGTTGNKATLFDAEEGLALASAFEAYPTSYPQPGWAEQDPADWERAVWQATRRLLTQTGIDPAGIAAVSFSGTMQGVLLVDRQGAPLGQAIIWADQRATAEAEQMRSVCDPVTLYHLTGQRLSPAYSAPKLLWVRAHLPELFKKAYKLLQVKDYAAFLLTGVFATDPSDASSTLLFDLVGGHWATDLIEALGLDCGLLPEVHASTDVIGHVTLAAASASGLVAGTPVVIGGGDGACATVGAGSVREGEAYAYLGSSSWIALTSRQPIYDPQQRTYTMAHLIPGHYFPLGTMQAAGGSYGWLERLLYPLGNQQAMETMDVQAASIPAGANGLLFLPYLMGERSPYWNPQARGALVGLAMPHGQAEFARAVLEGVALNLGLILEILRAQNVQVNRLLLIGGGAQSPVWRQILADVLDLPVWLPALTTEATALGAVIAGGIGVGLFKDFNIVDKLVSARPAEQPEPARHQHYAALLEIFRETYDALNPIFTRLARLAALPVKDE